MRLILLQVRRIFCAVSYRLTGDPTKLCQSRSKWLLLARLATVLWWQSELATTRTVARSYEIRLRWWRIKSPSSTTLGSSAEVAEVSKKKIFLTLYWRHNRKRIISQLKRRVSARKKKKEGKMKEKQSFRAREKSLLNFQLFAREQFAIPLIISEFIREIPGAVYQDEQKRVPRFPAL